MDQIDLNLLEAWNRIGAKCRTDRLEALKRYARTHKDVMRRIPRDCCLCLRAADQRINAHTAAFEFDDEDSTSDIPQAFTSTDMALHYGVSHTVTLTGDRIRKLCAPVMIDWPGIPASDAAKRLGISPKSLCKWIECGWVKILRYDHAMSLGQRGKPVPIVWTPSPVDACAVAGEPPDAIWGTLWQWRHEKIPDDHSLTAKRVPRWRVFRGRKCLIGWDWICPGRIQQFTAESAENAEEGRNGLERGHGDQKSQKGQSQLALESVSALSAFGGGCGRRVRNLYGPLTLWTLPRAIGSELSLAMPDDSRLIGEWNPGMNDPLVGRRSFACNRCWNIQGMTMTNSTGWNLFVSHMSGGLLFGYEVERSRMEAPAKRRKRFAARPNRRAIGLRAQIIDLLMLGFERSQIARTLHIGMHCLDSHIKVIHREHGAHSRVELALKLARTLAIRPRPVPERIVERRIRVRQLQAEGLSLRTIAVRLGVNLKTAHADVKAMRGDKRPQRGIQWRTKRIRAG